MFDQWFHFPSVNQMLHDSGWTVTKGDRQIGSKSANNNVPCGPLTLSASN